MRLPHLFAANTAIKRRVNDLLLKQLLSKDGVCKIAILNMKPGPEWHMLRWTAYEEFLKERNGEAPMMKDYDLKYVGAVETLLPGWTVEQIESHLFCFLEGVYCMFQDGRVEGYKGHSLSMSDVIGFSDGKGNARWFYVDRVDFEELEWEA